MKYSLEYNNVMSLVEQEVSREASQAYAEDGTSLYDGIRMISRDEEMKQRIMSEVLVAIKAQCNRFIKRASLEEPETGETEPTSFEFELEFSARRAAGKELSLMTTFRSMVVNFIVNKYFASKNLVDLATKYNERASVDVQTLTKLLFEKLPPVYPETYE
jgi:hypothetical protein